MKKYFFVVLALGSQFISNAQTPNIAEAKLNQAVIYRTGAELTHTVMVNVKQGNNEIIFDKVANGIDENSIQIKADKAIAIMGIEQSSYYMNEAPKNASIIALEDSIKAIQSSIDKNALLIANTNELMSVLRSNKEIKGAQNGLSVTELMKMMDYYKVKYTQLQQELTNTTTANTLLQATMAKLRQQLQEEKKKNTNSNGRLTVQITSALAGKYEFQISYLVYAASWEPFYDVRVDDTKSPLKLVHKAKITQQSGIDWKQVKLSLSTASPSQWSNAPNLSTWFLSYILPQYRQAALSKANASLDEVVVVGYGTQKQEDGNNEQTNIRLRGSSSINQNAQPLYIVNGQEMGADEFKKISPNNIKKIDVLKNENATAMYGSKGTNGVIVVTLKEGLEDYVSISENDFTLTFDIDLPYDVPTNGKEQTAVLKTTEVPATYQYLSVPKLDKEVFITANVKDWEKLNLLPGAANIIYEGTYMGKSFIDPTTTNDSLSITLGKDKRVVVTKEKKNDFSSVKFLGANKLQQLTYDITVKNNKKEAISLLLKDQLPVSTTKEIEVESIEVSGAKVDTETGILQWDINLKANESKVIRITYSVKYPKDKVLNLK